jgi:uncharacterized low-complexity protein
MPKKNIRIALSTLTLLGAATVQADEQLEYQSLGTGEEIRAEILPVADEDDSSEDKTAKAKKKKEEKKKKKATEGKCGEGTCKG